MLSIQDISSNVKKCKKEANHKKCLKVSSNVKKISRIYIKKEANIKKYQGYIKKEVNIKKINNTSWSGQIYNIQYE